MIWARPKALHYADGRECMVRIAVAAFVVVGGGVLVGGIVAWFSIVVESFRCSIRCCGGLCRVRAGRFSWFRWQWPQGPSAQHGSFRRAFSGNQQKKVLTQGSGRESPDPGRGEQRLPLGAVSGRRRKRVGLYYFPVASCPFTPPCNLLRVWC